MSTHSNPFVQGGWYGQSQFSIGPDSTSTPQSAYGALPAWHTQQRRRPYVLPIHAAQPDDPQLIRSCGSRPAPLLETHDGPESRGLHDVQRRRREGRRARRVEPAPQGRDSRLAREDTRLGVVASGNWTAGLGGKRSWTGLFPESA